jgi:hypothetical protein
LATAIRLLAEGKEWREVYALCIDNHAALDPEARRQRQQQLRYRTKRMLLKAMKAEGISG